LCLYLFSFIIFFIFLFFFFFFFFFFNDTATTEIYTLSLHDALPICRRGRQTAFILSSVPKTYFRSRPTICSCPAGRTFSPSWRRAGNPSQSPNPAHPKADIFSRRGVLTGSVFYSASKLEGWRSCGLCSP